MLIPKLNKFQAIPKKKYRVISEDPQTCVKPFPWKPGVRKTSLENWKTNTRWSSRIRNVSSSWNNLCKLWRTRSFSLVSDTISLPQCYNKKINYHTRVSFFKKKKILSHLNTVAFTAIKQVSAIWCKLFMMQIIYLDKWKTIAVRIETFISDTAHDPIKTSLSPN